MALFEFLFVIQNSLQSFEWQNIGQNAVFVVKNVNFEISLTEVCYRVESMSQFKYKFRVQSQFESPKYISNSHSHPSNL